MQKNNAIIPNNSDDKTSMIADSLNLQNMTQVEEWDEFIRERLPVIFKNPDERTSIITNALSQNVDTTVEGLNEELLGKSYASLNLNIPAELAVYFILRAREDGDRVPGGRLADIEAIEKCNKMLEASVKRKKAESITVVTEICNEIEKKINGNCTNIEIPQEIENLGLVQLFAYYYLCDTREGMHRLDERFDLLVKNIDERSKTNINNNRSLARSKDSQEVQLFYDRMLAEQIRRGEIDGGEIGRKKRANENKSREVRNRVMQYLNLAKPGAALAYYYLSDKNCERIKIKNALLDVVSGGERFVQLMGLCDSDDRADWWTFLDGVRGLLEREARQDARALDQWAQEIQILIHPQNAEELVDAEALSKAFATLTGVYEENLAVYYFLKWMYPGLSKTEENRVRDDEFVALLEERINRTDDKKREDILNYAVQHGEGLAATNEKLNAYNLRPVYVRNAKELAYYYVLKSNDIGQLDVSLENIMAEIDNNLGTNTIMEISRYEELRESYFVNRDKSRKYTDPKETEKFEKKLRQIWKESDREKVLSDFTQVANSYEKYVQTAYYSRETLTGCILEFIDEDVRFYIHTLKEFTGEDSVDSCLRKLEMHYKNVKNNHPGKTVWDRECRLFFAYTQKLKQAKESIDTHAIQKGKLLLAALQDEFVLTGRPGQNPTNGFLCSLDRCYLTKLKDKTMIFNSDGNATTEDATRAELVEAINALKKEDFYPYSIDYAVLYDKLIAPLFRDLVEVVWPNIYDRKPEDKEHLTRVNARNMEISLLRKDEDYQKGVKTEKRQFIKNVLSGVQNVSLMTLLIVLAGRDFSGLASSNEFEPITRSEINSIMERIGLLHNDVIWTEDAAEAFCDIFFPERVRSNEDTWRTLAAWNAALLDYQEENPVRKIYELKVSK